MREEDRPRNRLINNGAASLSNHELLSIIIRSGSVQEMAITGIKEGKAAQIAACFELARRPENFTKDSKIKIVYFWHNARNRSLTRED